MQFLKQLDVCEFHQILFQNTQFFLLECCVKLTILPNQDHDDGTIKNNNIYDLIQNLIIFNIYEFIINSFFFALIHYCKCYKERKKQSVEDS